MCVCWLCSVVPHVRPLCVACGPRSSCRLPLRYPCSAPLCFPACELGQGPGQHLGALPLDARVLQAEPEEAAPDLLVLVDGPREPLHAGRALEGIDICFAMLSNIRSAAWSASTFSKSVAWKVTGGEELIHHRHLAGLRASQAPSVGRERDQEFAPGPLVARVVLALLVDHHGLLPTPQGLYAEA